MSALTDHLTAALDAAYAQEFYIGELHDQLAELESSGVRSVGPATDSFPERLEFALTRWGGGLRAFAREMQKTGVRGTSYRSLSNYRNGDFLPKRIWIEEAARILDINFGWLKGG